MTMPVQPLANLFAAEFAAFSPECLIVDVYLNCEESIAVRKINTDGLPISTEKVVSVIL
jgi:hypothetical protein